MTRHGSIPDPKALGRAGENEAARHLMQQGYTLLAANYTTRFAEIDIIAQKEACICFVEVKTRSSYRKGRAGEAVTKSKQRKIILAAQQYLKENKKQGSFRVRFDVVEVLGREGSFTFTHIPHAFRAG